MSETPKFNPTRYLELRDAAYPLFKEIEARRARERKKEAEELSTNIDPLQETLTKDGFIFSDEVPTGSGYIMPDGSFFGVRTNNFMFTSDLQRKCLHPDLDAYVRNKYRIFVVHVLMYSDNAIRMCDGKNFDSEHPYIVFPQGEITSAQYESLITWLYALMEKREDFVTFYLGEHIFNNTSYATRFYLNRGIESGFDIEERYFPEDIIKKIKRLVNESKIKEAQ